MYNDEDYSMITICVLRKEVKFILNDLQRVGNLSKETLNLMDELNKPYKKYNVNRGFDYNLR